MPILDFARGRRSVQIGGRVFRVGPPTWETLIRLLMLYREEIEAARVIFAGTTFDLDTGLALLAKSPERFGSVLETCVEATYPIVSWPHERLAKECLGFNDVDREIVVRRILDAFVQSVRFTAGTVEEFAEDDEFCSVAALFGVSPMDLAKWPLEAYVSAREHAERLRSRTSKTERVVELVPDAHGVAVM